MTNLPRLPRVMTHVFPAASEYDQDHRRRVQQRKVVFMSFGVTVAAALIAFFMKSTILFTRAIHSANLLKHKGFEVIEQVTINEIEADAIVYRHKKTRTDVMTIVPRDTLQDSVFGISFRTLPTADNGAIHVLQRSILDGSVRYPVKDPIHELRKGSLQTYMNAETFEDRTLYSAASRNQQDFSNLVSVHLDAVFNPMCVRKEGDWIFRQEGWRLERVDDQTRDLNFNGNTYNDMMGIYGDPDELIKRYGRRALFGDTHYGFDAQGEPDEILSLTQKDINDTYDSFYHPTNAQVFLYGPIDTIKDSMDILDSHLRHYKPRFDLVQGSTPAWQPKDRKSRVEEVHPFPSSHNKDNYQVVLSWLLNDEKMDYETELKWKMIEQLLVGTPTAAISAALLNHPVVGSEVIGGLDTRHQQVTFSVGLKGVKRENVLDVEERITNSLERVKKNGAFTSDLLAGALNTLELELRDQASGNEPRGVRLMHKIYEKWNYGVDPTDVLAFEKAWGNVLDEVETSGSKPFLKLIEKNLIDNKHSAVVQLFPETGMVHEMEVQEQAKIERMQKELSKEDFTKLLAEAASLRQVQEKPDKKEALDMIPRVPLESIEKMETPNTINLRVEQGLLVAKTRVPESFGLLYVDFGIDLRLIDFEDSFLIPLMADVMMATGTETWTEDQLYQQISRFSGGIEPVVEVQNVRPSGAQEESFVVNDGTYLDTKIFFRGKCLAENLGPYLNIISQIVFKGSKFLHSRVQEAAIQRMEEIDVAIYEDGASFVDRRIEARYSRAGLIKETLYGFSQLLRLHEDIWETHHDFDYLQERLSNVRLALQKAHRNGMVLSVTGQADLLENAQRDIDNWIVNEVPRNEKAIPFANPAEEAHPWNGSMDTEQSELAPIIDEGVIVPAAVSFFGKGGQIYDVGEHVKGSGSVVAKYIENGFLYENFVLEDGAFDAMARLSYEHGTIRFLAFRDPNRDLVETLKAMDSLATAMTRDVLNSETLPEGAQEAVVAAIAELDGSAPQPNELGYRFLLEYLRDDTAEYRQLWRNQILATTRDDFASFIEDLLEWRNPSVAAISTIQEFAAAKNQTGLDLTLVKVPIA